MVTRRQTTRNRGTVLVEAALVFPILILLTFGAMEYGWLFLQAQATDNAARAAVRMGVRPDATAGEVQAAIANSMSAAGLGNSGYTVHITPSDVTTMSPGDTLTVSVTVPYAGVSLTKIPFIPTPASLHASVGMAKEGP